MNRMHPLLAEKLLIHFRDDDPKLKEFGAFVSEIDALFENFDSARRMLEESMQLTSSELISVNKEKQAKNIELSTLYKLATITQNVGSLNEVFAQILHEVKSASSFPVAFIALMKEKTSLLKISFLGPDGTNLENLEIQTDKTILTGVLNPGEPVIEQHIVEFKAQDDFLKKLKIQTLLSVPMKVDGKIIGFLSMADVKHRSLEPSLVKLTELLSAHVGALIVRKQSEFQLAELLRSLPDENPNPILRVSPDGIILYANSASGELLKLWDSKNGGILPDVLIAAIRRALKEKSSIKMELNVASKALIILVFPMENYANIYVTDITELKNTEIRMRQQEGIMVAASKLASLGEMAGGIAHEINNPLAIIHANGNLLRDLMSEEFDKVLGLKIIEKILGTTERIAKIIRGLRAISRNGDEDPFDLVTVEQIIEDALAICREKFKIQGIEIKIENSSPLTNIECKKVQIIQVLINFLNNAYDAIETLPERWVKVGVREYFDNIEISVTDSGSGLPLHVKEKLCKPFFTTKKPGKGTGLGLSISKGIIESHKGKLWIDGECKNTCFIIRIPKHQSTLEPKVA